MTCFRYISVLCLSLCSVVAFSQNSDRDCIRMGNKSFREKDYNKAETYYRKALDKNPSLEAFYNLGNSLAFQNKDSVAFEQYKQALEQVAETPEKKAFVYHNMGNLAYVVGCSLMKANSPDATKSFAQAVELYKSALRCSPTDNETRYNLAMAQYMLKKNQQKNQNNNQQNQNQQDKEKNKDKNDKSQGKDQDNQDKDKNKNQDKKDQGDQDKDNQDKNKQDQNKDKNQDKQQSQEGQMDDKTAEQLLNSAQQDEKAVQRKVQKAEKAHRNGLEKDW